MNETKKCKRPGCFLKYSEDQNTDTSCLYVFSLLFSYHDGKPIFHDCKKGWTCCNVVVYEWDEFNKIKGCKNGRHTDVKVDNEFYKNDRGLATATEEGNR